MKYLKLVLLFLIPIIRKAILQAAADEVVKLAYPETKSKGGYIKSFDPRPRKRMSLEELDTDYDEDSEFHGVNTFADDRPTTPFEKKPYHDVLMVAFDITGTTQQAVHEFLALHMPPAIYYPEDNLSIDSWWIADDGAGIDLDSAVFVRSGMQAEARELLRIHGLVD